MSIFLRTALVFGIASTGFSAALSVVPSVAEPVKVGTPLTWRATLDQTAAPSAVWYRFRVRGANSPRLRTVRDYSPVNSLDWTPLDGEGTYEIQVSAHDRNSNSIVDTTTFYKVTPRADAGVPVITPTANRLVFLYSAPPCAEGDRMRIDFAPVGGGKSQSTSLLTCDGRTSMNAFLAGIRQTTQYSVHHTILHADGNTSFGPEVTFTTEALNFAVPATRNVNRLEGGSGEGFLLQSSPFAMNLATDLDGNVVWYNPSTEIRYLTRVEQGGLYIAEIDDWNGDDSRQLLRVLDVAGNIVAETNAGRINDLLAARRQTPITSFHHDARLLDDGRLLVLAGTERMYTDMQGDGDVVVIGDAILVLDADLQIEWDWNAFNHMDIRREAILGEKCMFGSGGCPVFRLAPVGNDWVHGNSVQLTADGHILYSARHQDWLLKIDYANGRGSGNIIWRLGKDGDFNVQSLDPEPWFSHQHDGNFELDAPDRLIVFDNGNTRWARDQSIHSRGQVWRLDEETRTAELIHNFDLGDYSRALGSAEKLSNGNYQFGLGWDSRNFSQSLEYDLRGQLMTHLETESQMYRAYRLKDLYGTR